MNGPLRVIIAGFPGPYAPRILERTLQQLPVESCIAVCKSRKYVPNLPSAHVEWHPSFHFREAEASTVDWNNIAPLDEAFLCEMRDCESMVLTMLERYEMHGDLITYQERQREYLRQLRYWNHILEKRRINLFILPDIPHLPLTYVLYSLCKKKGIAAMYFNLCPMPDTFFVIEDWEKSSVDLQKAYERCLLQYTSTPPENISLAPKFEQLYASQTSSIKDPVIWYMKWKLPSRFGRWKQQVLGLLRTSPLRFATKAASFFVRHLHPQFRQRRRVLRQAKRSFAFYHSHCTQPDYTKKFVYFPLHVQPECTTSPMAGDYVHQLLIAQMLSFFLPQDVEIYIKEHPRQREYFPYGTARPLTFYEDLLKVPRVRFLAPSANTFTLTRQCMAVATATGTPGFEAIFRGKPVLMFGHNYYQFARGVYPIHSTEDCRTAINEIFVQGIRPQPEDARIFLKAIEEVSMEGYYDQEYHEVSHWSDQENLERVSSSLVRYIRERVL